MKQRLHTCYLALLLAALILLGSGSAAWAADTCEVNVNQNTRIDVQITDDSGRAVAPGREMDDIKYMVYIRRKNIYISINIIITENILNLLN